MLCCKFIFFFICECILTAEIENCLSKPSILSYFLPSSLKKPYFLSQLYTLPPILKITFPSLSLQFGRAF